MNIQMLAFKNNERIIFYLIPCSCQLRKNKPNINTNYKRFGGSLIFIIDILCLIFYKQIYTRTRIFSYFLTFDRHRFRCIQSLSVFNISKTWRMFYSRKWNLAWLFFTKRLIGFPWILIVFKLLVHSSNLCC